MRVAVLAAVAFSAVIGASVLGMKVFDDRALAQNRELRPQRIVIGIDLSRSNPLIDNPAFAARVGQRVAGIVRSLDYSSEVHIRTFGNYDPFSNSFEYDAVLSVRQRPDFVAAEVQRLIAGTPGLVRSGKWKSQENTNILAFIDNVHESIGCTGMPTTIVLATDGLEDSEYARLANEKNGLPLPTGAPYRGCTGLTILGLGQGAGSPRSTARLRGEWERWARAAGFARFIGLNDW
jgi:hypothetical protein